MAESVVVKEVVDLLEVLAAEEVPAIVAYAEVHGLPAVDASVLTADLNAVLAYLKSKYGVVAPA